MRFSPVSPRLGLTLALAALLTPALRADSAKPAPPRQVGQLIDVLFTAPAVTRTALSPDGRHLSFMCEIDDRNVAGVYDLEKHTQKLAGGVGVTWCRWAGSDQLLLGIENKLYISDIAMTDVRQVPLPDRHVRWEVDSWRPQDPDHMLFRSYPHSDLYCDLHVLTISTRRINQLESASGRVTVWAVDEQNQVRLTATPVSDNAASFQCRDNPTAPWHAEPLPKTAYPLFFSPDGQSLIISHLDHGRRVVQNYNLQQHHLTGAPLLSDPFCDVDPRVIRDNLTGTPVGLVYNAEKPQFLWFNPQYLKLHTLIQRSFPGQVVSILGVMPGNRVLFEIYSDTTPPAYYALDLAHPGISLLVEAMPAAAKYAWAPTLPVTFAVRDGYEVHGYLTLPLRRQPGRPGPLIAFSHGGPVARDTWDFDPEVQYFAALGYAVLQVNYRGSSGYGVAHQLKDTLAVCGKSVDDVVDGIAWAVKAGYADPKRIAVYGASYGGYISLAIATRFPDVPAAAIGFAGVYDWENQYSHERTVSYERMAFLSHNSEYYIDPKAAPERYRAFSPANFAGQVRCPVLLLHGGADQVVDIAQTKLMASALRRAGKSVEVVKDAEVIHGLPREKERRNFYEKIAGFLLKNVPPDPAS
jgi:dipeptidyl aminopeptidase/acylaminoacyl peptidase